MIKKRLRTLGLRREIPKSPNRKSSISVIMVASWTYSTELLQVVSHSKEQQHDCIGRPEPVSIIFCSSWKSFQNPHVPFELEWFQFFTLTARSRVCYTKRFFQGVEGKRLQVILSLILFLPFLFLFLHYLCVLLYYFESI